MRVEDHQRLWLEHWITGTNTKVLRGIGGKNVNILAPRGSGKSSLIGLFAAWIVGHHAKYQLPCQLLYISNCLPVARDKSRAIKQIITSPEYRAIFPTVVKGDRFSDQMWSIDTSIARIETTGSEYYTLKAAGIKGAIASKRCHIVIYDDLIKSADDIANANVRAQYIRNHRQVIKPTVFEGGRIIGIGTRFRPDDIHAKEFLKEKGWEVIEQSALVTDQETGSLYSYWEKMWSTDYLKGLLEADPLSFSFQYQNKIMNVPGGIRIEPDWIHWGSPPKTFTRLAVGIDFAASETDKACYTAMVLVGQHENTFWILDYRRGKWVGNCEKIDILLNMVDDWKDSITPCYVFAEAIAYQASFKGDYISYAVNQKRRFDLHIHPSKLKGDKVSHLMSVTGLYANGLVKYNKYIDFTYPISEMTGFQSEAEYSDCLDATVLALNGLGVRPQLSMI
jgi:phage terminase large subunit-like protein